MVSRGGHDKENITVSDKKGLVEYSIEDYMKQNDEQFSEPRFELLAYALYHLDRHPVNNIGCMILQFYNADMINEAK